MARQLSTIAGKRGLQEPAPSDLAHLQTDVTLSAAVSWWEQVQRKQRAAPADVDAEAYASERSNVMIKVAAISVLVFLALLAFPREVAGEWFRRTCSNVYI